MYFAILNMRHLPFLGHIAEWLTWLTGMHSQAVHIGKGGVWQGFAAVARHAGAGASLTSRERSACSPLPDTLYWGTGRLGYCTLCGWVPGKH